MERAKDEMTKEVSRTRNGEGIRAKLTRTQLGTDQDYPTIVANCPTVIDYISMRDG